jgi:hypothetical protein
VGARQLDGGDGFLQHLLLAFLELVYEVNRAGGDEGVDARAFGVLQALGGALHVQGAAAGQCGHLRPGELAADGIDGLEIAFAGDGEAGFQDVDSQLDQFPGHFQLFGHCHAATRRLFAVAQGGIENVYAVAHKSIIAVCR